MPATTTPLTFRHIQTVWGFAMAFAVVCVVFGGFTRKAFEGGLNWRHWALIGLVVWLAFSGFSIRRKLLNRANSTATGSTPNASAKTWAAAQLLGIGSALGIVAWGLVSNVRIASPDWLSNAIYVTGILLLFRFKPSKPAYVA